MGVKIWVALTVFFLYFNTCSDVSTTYHYAMLDGFAKQPVQNLGENEL